MVVVQFVGLLDLDQVLLVVVVVRAQDMVAQDLQPVQVRRVGESIMDLVIWLY